MSTRGQGTRSIDQVPLQNFYTEAICLDLSNLPLEHAIKVNAMEVALAASGQQVAPGDTVLIWMATNERLLGKPGDPHDFTALSPAAVHWLADQGIGMFCVKATRPAPEDEPNVQAHMACAKRRITHMECLATLDKLIGQGRFRFIGFPQRMRSRTASPIPAVAMFEERCSNRSGCARAPPVRRAT
jgi:kynurenine formamidase